MSLQSSIVINDGQAAPVAHTFSPKGARNKGNLEVAVWRDQSPVNAEGYPSITENHTPVNSNGMEKFEIVIDIPTLEVPGSGSTFVPAPTRAYGTIGKIGVWASRRATEQELKDIVAFIRGYVGTSLFYDMIVKREPSW